MVASNFEDIESEFFAATECWNLCFCNKKELIYATKMQDFLLLFPKLFFFHIVYSEYNYILFYSFYSSWFFIIGVKILLSTDFLNVVDMQ